MVALEAGEPKVATKGSHVNFCFSRVINMETRRAGSGFNWYEVEKMRPGVGLSDTVPVRTW